MDREAIERVRGATFPNARRGYDKHEVDRFLEELAAWLASDGAGPDPDEARDELERIGEQTKSILTGAHDAAREIRSQAEQDVRGQLTEANLASESVRSRAEEEAQRVREEADAYARRTKADADEVRSEAEDYAARVRSEANEEISRTRAAAERAVGVLEERRARIAEDLRRLASEAAGEAEVTDGPSAKSPGAAANGVAGPDEETRPIPIERRPSASG